VADYVQSRGCIYREASEQDCFVLIMIGLRCEILPTQDDDPEMNYNANETLNRLFARAIYLWNGLQDEAATDDEDLRKSFLAAWEPLMSRWEAAYPSRSESFLSVLPGLSMDSLMLLGYFMIVLGLNMRLMLTLFALRFRAPAKDTKELLKRCWELALSTLSVVAEWAQEARAREALVYASNYVLLNIAYSSVLALKVSGWWNTSDCSSRVLPIVHRHPLCGPNVKRLLMFCSSSVASEQTRK
jgi:hypothetical protein